MGAIPKIKIPMMARRLRIIKLSTLARKLQIDRYYRDEAIVSNKSLEIDRGATVAILVTTRQSVLTPVKVGKQSICISNR
jgi:hypothetical protein